MKFKRIQFEYCECGCHGSASYIEGFKAGWGPQYWVYNDLRGNYELYRGHGRYGGKVGDFKSYQKVLDLVNEQFAKDAQDLLAAT